MSQSYEEAKLNYWNEAVLHGALEVDKDLLFDHAFKCGYDLGKQEKDAELTEDNFAKSEPEPAEPKNEESATLHPESIKKSRIASEEQHLRNLSQETANCDKFTNRDLCDKLIKRGFKNHNRLHIAAMAMQGILSNSNQQMVDMPIDRVARLADAMASILIAECEKGERNDL